MVNDKIYSTYVLIIAKALYEYQNMASHQAYY